MFYLVGLGFVLSVIYSAYEYKYKPSFEEELLDNFLRALIAIEREKRAVFLKHLLVFALKRKQRYEKMVEALVAVLGMKFFTSWT